MTPPKWIVDKRNGLLYVLYTFLVSPPLFSNAVFPLYTFHILLSLSTRFAIVTPESWRICCCSGGRKTAIGRRRFSDWPRNGWEPTVLQLMGSLWPMPPCPRRVFGIKIYDDFILFFYSYFAPVWPVRNLPYSAYLKHMSFTSSWFSSIFVYDVAQSSHTLNLHPKQTRE